MTTPERKDLARALIEEMEMHLAERARPEKTPPFSRSLVRSLSRSRLWPLRSDEPLAGLFQDRAEVAATIVWQDPDRRCERDESFGVTVRRSDESETVQLAFDGLPDGWEPLCMVIGRLGDWPTFEPATSEKVVRKTVPPPVTRVSQRTAESLSAALADGVGRADTDQNDESVEPSDAAKDAQPAKSLDAKSLSLAADTGSVGAKTGAQTKDTLLFESPHLACSYVRSEALLQVAASLPDDRQGALAVAELSCIASGGARIVQRRRVFLKVPDDKAQDQKQRGWVRFRVPADIRGGEFQIHVRPFTDNDLDLLGPDEASELLASRSFASIHLKKDAAGGYTFRPLMPHQQRVLRDPAACWCLRVAPRDEEGSQDV